jgi:hypothetical protein
VSIVCSPLACKGANTTKNSPKNLEIFSSWEWRSKKRRQEDSFLLAIVSVRHALPNGTASFIHGIFITAL